MWTKWSKEKFGGEIPAKIQCFKENKEQNNIATHYDFKRIKRKKSMKTLKFYFKAS